MGLSSHHVLSGFAGSYPRVVEGKDLSLHLSVIGGEGVTYFGYWLSALDAGNYLKLKYKGKLLFTFTPSDVLKLVSLDARYKGMS